MWYRFLWSRLGSFCRSFEASVYRGASVSTRGPFELCLAVVGAGAVFAEEVFVAEGVGQRIGGGVD